MNLKKTISLLTILFLLLFSPFCAKSQTAKENSMAKAIQLFDTGNFAEAEPLFKNILVKTPNDFMANYFHGACRTENKHFTNADLDALIKANQEVSPLDINYYFGVQYHARSNWERALKFYNKYNSIAALTDDEKQKILEKIQQCYDKINPYEKYIIEENNQEIIPLVIDTTSTETIIIAEAESKIEKLEVENAGIIVASISNQEEEKKEVEDLEIEFHINVEITYILISQFKTDEGKIFFEQGISKQTELESSLILIDELRDKYNNSQTTDEKKMIGQNIISLENETYLLKKEAVQLLFQAKNKEAEYWANADQKEIDAFKIEFSQLIELNNNKLNKKENIEFDSTVIINPYILLGNNEIVSVAEEAAEKDLVYKIQIGAYSRGLPNYIQKLFDQLSLIRKIETYTDDRGVVVYTIGNMTNYENALTMQNQVRQEGVEDAYVVPYFKGKRITLKEAKKLEAEK